MPTRKFLFLMLLSAVSAVAATPDFLLGADYSQWLPSNTTQIATDNSGAIYLLTVAQGVASDTPPSTVTKLTADAKTILWRTPLSFVAGNMVVDPGGDVYVIPNAGAPPPLVVSKLRADGTGVAWTQATGLTAQSGLLPAIAVDSGGRLYLAGTVGNDVHDSQIVRMTADGAIDYRTALQGRPNSMAVDGSGNAVVTGYVGGDVIFVARFTRDGTAGFYSTVTNSGGPAVALDPSGNAVVCSYGMILRFDAAGQLTSSKKISEPGETYSSIAMDAGGNSYLVGAPPYFNRSTAPTAGYPVKNSTVPCGRGGTGLLTIVTPDGSILQKTYVPGITTITAAPVVVGRDSSVLVMGWAPADYVPTRSGPFGASTSSTVYVLARFVPNINAQPLSLVCASNGAVYVPSAVVPGEIFILYGTGLGPDQGVEFRATVDRPYPTGLSDVQVTFDGRPVPLIWVQNSQINLVTPWSLTPGRDTEVCVSYQGVKTNCLTLPVKATDPGVFTKDGSYAIAFNEDGGENTEFHAAAPNTQVTVFATGLGPITPSQAEGTIMGSTVPGNVLQIAASGVKLVVSGPRGSIDLVAVQTEVTSAGPALYYPVGISKITFRVVPNVNEYYVILPSGKSQTFIIYNVN